jgi:hypothetical protein
MCLYGVHGDFMMVLWDARGFNSVLWDYFDFYFGALGFLGFTTVL